jgi:hypothetical protein
MSDIVKRLRVPDEEWMPKGTRVILMYNNTLYEPDNFSLWYGSAIKLEAAAEIERLRARVAVMETALTRYAEDEYNGYNATGAYARAALEAKP